MITQEVFGALGGEAVTAIILSNKNGVKAKLITYGARLTELWVPDRNGALADIVLGFDDVDSYVATDTFFGATCGRYGNRITNGQFSLEGEAIQLDVNEAPNHLHGGVDGLDRKNWAFEINEAANSVAFTCVSPDGEMGFPGKAELRATYTLGEDNVLRIDMEGDVDKHTILNLVHHSYFNLAGQGSGSVLDQQIHLNSRFFTPIDDELMPTGEILSVANTPYDFRTLRPIGGEIAKLESVGSGIFGEGGGYDHNWCLDNAGQSLRPCAEAFDPASGRVMRLETSEPGVQFYTGGYLNTDIVGKQGLKLCKYAGFTLETQKFPDAPNNAHFPDCELHPGEHYHHTMVFSFSAR
ncbi:aldose epimerase [Devosia epidermidihirudinis]|uniref:Aldose 1-epimerase n=1 Tax=Devosia epidermidihirudinis TaxID=1293439 RepID=A0A0F5QB97_9HYPH|nr:aldose epimerase family protein [Devosia epidermidihirudinis]KKC37269.1 aldose epimerase [Devosia epidermidihirudinis]